MQPNRDPQSETIMAGTPRHKPASGSDQSRSEYSLLNSTAGRIGLGVGLFLAGSIALRLGETVIVPILVSLLLATVLGPVAWWLYDRLKVRWSLACIVVVVLMIVANVMIASVFSASVMRLVNQLSDEPKVIRVWINFRAQLQNVVPIELDEEIFPKNPQALNEIPVFRYLADATPYMLGRAARYATDWSWHVIIILFITFFVLLEGRLLARRAAAIFGPSAEVQAHATEVLIEMAKQVRNYLVWRTIINLGLMVVMGLVYQAVGLSQAWTWAILLAILNYIPYFGPVLASIPPFLDAFIFNGPTEAIIVTIAFWVVVVLEGYLVVPLLMGRNMDLNATTVMVACLFWELVWPGMTGLFLAMPIMAGIKAILHHVPEWRVWGDLMSSTEPEEKAFVAEAEMPTVDIKPGGPVRIEN